MVCVAVETDTPGEGRLEPQPRKPEEGEQSKDPAGQRLTG